MYSNQDRVISLRNWTRVDRRFRALIAIAATDGYTVINEGKNSEGYILVCWDTRTKLVKESAHSSGYRPASCQIMPGDPEKSAPPERSDEQSKVDTE